MSTENAEIGVRRPTGVSLLVGLNLIGAVVVMLLASSGRVPSSEAGIMFISGVVGVIVALGLWALQPWARWLAIIAYGINIAVALSQPNPLGAVLAGSLMAYLAFNTEVRLAFVRKPSELPSEAGPSWQGPAA